MDTTAEKSVTTSTLADVRQAPLGQLSLFGFRAAGPSGPQADKGKVAVAAFNASL